MVSYLQHSHSQGNKHTLFVCIKCVIMLTIIMCILKGLTIIDSWSHVEQCNCSPPTGSHVSWLAIVYDGYESKGERKWKIPVIHNTFSQIMAHWLTEIITVLEAVVVDSNCSVNIESHHFQRQQLGTTSSSYFSTKIVSTLLQHFWVHPCSQLLWIWVTWLPTYITLWRGSIASYWYSHVTPFVLLCWSLL